MQIFDCASLATGNKDLAGTKKLQKPDILCGMIKVFTWKVSRKSIFKNYAHFVKMVSKCILKIQNILNTMTLSWRRCTSRKMGHFRGFLRCQLLLVRSESWKYSMGQKMVFTHSAITSPKVNHLDEIWST